jgi:hypothetical protein
MSTAPTNGGQQFVFEMTHSLSEAKDLYFRSSDAYLRMIISINKILQECKTAVEQSVSHGREDDDVVFLGCDAV